MVLSRVLRNAKVGAVLLVSAVLLAEGCASAPPRQTSSSVASAAPAARSVVDGVFTPPDDPGSLGTEDYTDVLTYLLQLNGYPAGEEELPADLSVLMDVRFGI